MLRLNNSINFERPINLQNNKLFKKKVHLLEKGARKLSAIMSHLNVLLSELEEMFSFNCLPI